MSASWAAVVIGAVLGSGGLLSVVWHGGKLASLLEQLVGRVDEHEDRIRLLEQRPAAANRHRR